MDNLAFLVLENSYVLGITIQPYRVQFDMDFVLTPEHPKYASPSSGETECYRRGVMRICNFRSVAWRASNLKPSTDATGQQDYGCLDELVMDGRLVVLRGDWGEVEIIDGQLTVRLDE